MNTKEMFEIFKELEKTEKGHLFLEFAFNLNSFKAEFYSDSEVLCEHIIKLQLYSDSTAYKTICNIVFRLWRVCRKPKAQQYLDYDFVYEHLVESIIVDEKDYNNFFEEVYQETKEDYPTVYYKKDYFKFKLVLQECITTILDIRRPDRQKFYNNLEDLISAA